MQNENVRIKLTNLNIENKIQDSNTIKTQKFFKKLIIQKPQYKESQINLNRPKLTKK